MPDNAIEETEEETIFWSLFTTPIQFSF